MADAQEEILNFRISGATQAASELANYTQQLEKHRRAVQDYNTAVAAGQTPSRQQARSYQEATLPSGTFGPGVQNYADTAGLAARQAKLVDDGERAQRQLNDIIRQRTGKAAQEDAHEAFGQQARRNDPDRMTPGVQDVFNQHIDRIIDLLGKTDRARSDASRNKWSAQAGAAVEDLSGFQDTLYTRSFPDAQKRIREEVRRRTRAGQSISGSEFQGIERDFGTETVNADTDPVVLEQLARNQRSAGGNAWAAVKKAYSRNNLMSQATLFSAGYGAMQLGQDAAQMFATTQAGNRYTPEQMQRQLVGMLPGALAIAASPLGPGASLGAAGVGSAFTGIFDAGSSRDEGVRIAAEQMSQAMGLGTSAAKQWASTLMDTSKAIGVPVLELAHNVISASRIVGTLTPGGVAAQGQLQSLQGDTYAQAAAALQGFAARNPGDVGLRDALRSGVGIPGQAYGAALFSAAQGDRGGAYDLLMSAGVSNLSPQAQQLQANINAARNSTTGEGASGLQRFVNNIPGLGNLLGANRYVNQYQAQLDALNPAQKYVVAPGAQKSAVDFLADTISPSQYLVGQYGQSAAVYGAYGQQELMQGHGVAGLRANSVGQMSALAQQQNLLLGQQAAVQGMAGQMGPQLSNQLLLGIRSQLAEVRGGMLGVSSALFRGGLSESEAAFSGRQGRLGLAGQALTLSGASVFSRGVVGNFAEQRTGLYDRADTLAALAADHSNMLRPEEREQYRTQAAQLRVQGLGLRNQYAMSAVGEYQSTSALNSSRIGIQAARAADNGSTVDVLRAENARLDEQVALRRNLQGILDQGNLTLQQRQSIQSQLNQSVAQEIVQRKSVQDATFDALRNQAGQAVSALSISAGRREYFGGTTGASRADNLASFNQQLNNVRIAQTAYDVEDDPKQKWQRRQELESARADAEQGMVQRFGNFNEGPAAQGQRIRLEGQLQRQRMSIFAPGVPLAGMARLNALDAAQLRGVEGQRQYDRANGLLTQPVENALAQQEEGLKTGMLQRTQDANFGWMDRLVAMSVGSPSFASRIMPAPSDVAGLAEARGLGPMSARVFGFYNRKSFSGSQAMGLLPSDVNRYAFGYRPGDMGSGMTVGPTGDGGPLSTNPVDMVKSSGFGVGADSTTKGLPEALDALAKLLQNGMNLTVHVVDDRSGRTTSTVVNAKKNSDSTGIQRGGAGNVAQAARW